MPLQSIFIGGGTPSILSTKNWQTIFECIHSNFTLVQDWEWTIEANPESLTRELIECWAANGVNRISIGVQAIQPELRKTIGRNGDIARLPQIVSELHAAGINRLNLDFIFNIPGQTLEQWKDSLLHAISLKPTHISAYALTLEEGTKLASQPMQLSDDDFLQFWDTTDNTLAQAGFHRYEVSNFSLPGEECRHNLNIWHGATYLGCGPAATSFDGKDRWTNPPSLRHWLNGAPPEIDSLSPELRAAEILAFGMRVVNGWSWHNFNEMTGFNAMELRGTQINSLADKGLLKLSSTGAKPTRNGLLFNDDVIMELL